MPSCLGEYARIADLAHVYFLLGFSLPAILLPLSRRLSRYPGQWRLAISPPTSRDFISGFARPRAMPFSMLASAMLRRFSISAGNGGDAPCFDASGWRRFRLRRSFTRRFSTRFMSMALPPFGSPDVAGAFLVVGRLICCLAMSVRPLPPMLFIVCARRLCHRLIDQKLALCVG